MSDAALNATVVGREDPNERYWIVRVRPDRLPIPGFVPGQFIQLGLPQPARPRPGKPDRPAAGRPESPTAGRPESEVEPPRMRVDRRSYSIASSPRETGHLEFFLTVVPAGRLTPELWKLDVGGRCWIDDKALGSFTLERVPPGSDLAMVGTGTGIAPYLSMLRAHPADPPWRSFVLVHGARRADDLAYRTELLERERNDPRFRYVPIVSREPDGSAWTGRRGRVQAALGDLALDPARTHVFLCGNPDMIQSVRDDLAPKGFSPGTFASPGNVHFEKYW